MPFSFELHFDPETCEAVSTIWRALEHAGVCDARRNGISPHVTKGRMELLMDEIQHLSAPRLVKQDAAGVELSLLLPRKLAPSLHVGDERASIEND